MFTTVKTDEPNYMQIELSGITLQMANALRRTMMADVATVAIHEVTFDVNSTVMIDEMIAHRLGLVPLICDESADFENCEFTFDKVALNDEEIWYFDDGSFDDPAIQQAIARIPIVKVKHGQSLKFSATMRRGTGFEHAKWCPVATCFFAKTDTGYLFTIESNGSISPKKILVAAIDALKLRIENALKTIESSEESSE